MHFFTFEPGNGVSYRVLFGRAAAPTLLIPFYLLFGFAEEGDALITLYFDTDQISFETFLRRWSTVAHCRTLGTPDYLTTSAWTLLAALVGRNVGYPTDWHEDWRKRLPPAAWG